MNALILHAFADELVKLGQLMPEDEPGARKVRVAGSMRVGRRNRAIGGSAPRAKHSSPHAFSGAKAKIAAVAVPKFKLTPKAALLTGAGVLGASAVTAHKTGGPVAQAIKEDVLG